MFRNLLMHSLRSFKRQKAYMIINISGLSIGIACSLIIALYVINEASYDRYNVKKDRIFRLILNGKIGGQEITGAYTPNPIGPTMVKEFPEVEGFLRMNGRGPTVLTYNNQTFTEDDLIEADSSFFDFFTIPVLKGDVKNLLNSPHKIVLTESSARKILGNDDPIDKRIKIGTDTVPYVVTGIMGDVPENTHFEAHMLTSYMTDSRSKSTVWLSNSFSTYLLLKPNSSKASVESKLPDLLKKYVGPEVKQLMGISIDDFEAKGNKYRFFLQNIKDAHLDPSIQQTFKPACDPKYLIIFGSIAILIVAIAAINFMNLSTAQASKRAKEVGIKKIAGSTKGMLILQFLSESSILAIVSLLIAALIVKLTIPWINNMLGTALSLKLFSSWYVIPALVLFALLVGFFSGSYPALFLSSFNPYEVLKGETQSSMKTGRIRRVSEGCRRKPCPIS